MDILDLLSLGEYFRITKTDDGYDVEALSADLGAHISNYITKIRYYVISHCDMETGWSEIDMEELLKLKEFCELILKLEKEN